MRKRRGEKEKERREEEEEGRKKRRREGFQVKNCMEFCKELYGMFGTFVWNTWLICLEHVWNSCLGYEFFQPNSLYICRLGKTLTYKCVIWFFGLVGVLNGGKKCIEKMLGFREDVIRFFLKPCFCFSHNLAISHPH